MVLANWCCRWDQVVADDDVNADMVDYADDDSDDSDDSDDDGDDDSMSRWAASASNILT